MAVEKMEMMNIIGYLSDLDKISMQIVRDGSIHIVNALSEINENDFTVMSPDQSADSLIDFCFIKPYDKHQDYTDTNDKILELLDIFKISKGIRRKYIEADFKFYDTVQKVQDIHKEVKDYKAKLDKSNEELCKVIEFQENMKNIRSFNLDIGLLRNMNFFDFKIVRFSAENFSKLKDNIENIPSLIYRISSTQDGHVVISIAPKALSIEVDRIFKSLNFEEIPIPYDLKGTPGEIIKDLDEKIVQKRKEINDLEEYITGLKKKYGYFIDESYSRIRMFEKVHAVNISTACTNEFFYMAGWVPEGSKKGLLKRFEAFGDRVIAIFKPKSEVVSNMVPPTKLKNNWFTRPFESIVKMYGLPSYNELDPTSFVALSYLIMFGCMFGDLGQGFIFFAAGLFLTYKGHRPNFGGLLARLGISSMIFGTMFGSVFGNEELIEPFLIRPMDNINIVLIAAVALGIVFTAVASIYSLINAVKRRDIEEGVFGHNGVVGILFYWIILFTAYGQYMGRETSIPTSAVILFLCMLLSLMVLKQPISNLIKGHRPLYDVPMGDYYLENGFGVFETLLNMISNTISFIRVGAFALNHVGLFLAFSTLANLMKNSAGSIAMLVLGNIVIIGLEGLIVFIQGLRLEYYEIFSKFYEGDGFEYKPIELQYTSRLSGLNMPYSQDIKEISTLNM